MNKIINRSAIFTHIKKAVWERDGNQCRYCGVKAEKKFLCLDHVVPIILNGTHDYSNLVVSCRNCNNLKANDAVEKMLETAPEEIRIWWASFLAMPPENPPVLTKTNRGRPAGQRSHTTPKPLGYYSSVYLTEEEELLRLALVETLGVRKNTIFKMAIRELAAKHSISLTPPPTKGE